MYDPQGFLRWYVRATQISALVSIFGVTLDLGSPRYSVSNLLDEKLRRVDGSFSAPHTAPGDIETAFC